LIASTAARVPRVLARRAQVKAAHFLAAAGPVNPPVCAVVAVWAHLAETTQIVATASVALVPVFRGPAWKARNAPLEKSAYPSPRTEGVACSNLGAPASHRRTALAAFATLAFAIARVRGALETSIAAAGPVATVGSVPSPKASTALEWGRLETGRPSPPELNSFNGNGGGWGTALPIHPCSRSSLASLMEHRCRREAFGLKARSRNFSDPRIGDSRLKA
jgi:hypothetical protein